MQERRSRARSPLVVRVTRMDQLLLPYLQASDESERRQHLDHLLLVHAAPVVRQALRRRLGFYVDQRGINPRNQHAEDLYQQIIPRSYSRCVICGNLRKEYLGLATVLFKGLV